MGRILQQPKSLGDAFESSEWYPAAEALEILRAGLDRYQASTILCKRADAGIIRTHADLALFGSRRFECAELPSAFWWAGGDVALTQNWNSGDFETWWERQTRLQAFGVKFYKAAVDALVPPTTSTRPSLAPESKGRRMSQLWPDWVAELASVVHESGFPAGDGSRGSEEFIALIESRLIERGKSVPARSTVQETAKAVLRRLRSAGKD